MWKFKVEVDGLQYPCSIDAGVLTIPSLIVERPARVYAQNKGYPVTEVAMGSLSVIDPPDVTGPDPDPEGDEIPGRITVTSITRPNSPEPEGITCLTCHRVTTEETLRDGGDKTGPYCPDCGQGSEADELVAGDEEE